MKYRSIDIFMDVNKHGYYKRIHTHTLHAVPVSHSHSECVCVCVFPRLQWKFYCNICNSEPNYLWLLLYMCMLCVCLHDNWRLCCTWFIYFMNLILITLVGDFIFYSSIEARCYYVLTMESTMCVMYLFYGGIHTMLPHD